MLFNLKTLQLLKSRPKFAKTLLHVIIGMFCSCDVCCSASIDLLNRSVVHYHTLKGSVCPQFIHSFILKIYRAPPQENYSEALPVQPR